MLTLATLAGMEAGSSGVSVQHRRVQKDDIESHLESRAWHFCTGATPQIQSSKQLKSRAFN